MKINRDMYSPWEETKICAFRRGFAGVDPAPSHKTIQQSEYSFKCLIIRPWDHSDLYFDAIKWMEDTKAGIISGNYGVSYLDGKIYHTGFSFRSQEDLLAFKLKYPELS